MEKKYKYDAFISYRHADLDKFVAENLHKELEKFRLPKSLAKKRPGLKNRIQRVFRDKDELPLTSNLNDPIMSALNDSEFLIVICSPRLKESMWCKKEVETFVELRGREHILAVLVEGEPLESFPPQLLYRVERKENADGTVEEIKIPVEHFAADVRGKNRREVKKLIPREVQRICAGMFHIDFEDIHRRHREQKLRRILTASFVAGVVFLLFGIYSAIMALHIRNQNVELEARAAEIQMQAEQIAQQNEELARRQALSLAQLSAGYLEEGNRPAAISAAVESLTGSDGIGLPYTPEGQYALNESVRAYDIGIAAKAEYQIEVAGAVQEVRQSSNGEILAIFDDTGAITLFNLKERKMLAVISPVLQKVGNKEYFTFIGNDSVAYINNMSTVCILDLENHSLIKELSIEMAEGVVSDAEGKYLAVKQWDDTYVILDGSTYEELGVTADYGNGSRLDATYLFADDIMALVYCENTEQINVANQYQLKIINTNTMEMVVDMELKNKQVSDMGLQEGIVYLALSEYTEAYTKADAAAMAIDIQSGEVLWEHVQTGYPADRIELPQNPGATDLLFVTTETISMIQMGTGEVSFSEILSEQVLASMTYPNENNFLLFTANGEMYFISRDMELVLDAGYRFECKTTGNAFICNSGSGIAVTEYKDNKITVYTYKPGPEVVEIQDEIILPTPGDVYKDKEAATIAQSYGMEDSDFIQTLYYSPDEKYCFILYGDQRFAIYDVSNKQVVHIMESAYPTHQCLGTDAEGNTYLAGIYGIYVLNAEMKPVMWIEHAVNVDLDEKKVYLSWIDSNYEAPLYNVEDLLELAENYN